ncbi:MAG: XRE family transcriptional regulator [Parcubacteria group bacterium Greene0416_79]|nr:MAG: XRE family transcriptional regulator [Parcubacteria group bacterium Greene0416_79]
MKIKDLPKDSRPREKFLEKGPDALSKSELLAIVLGSGIQGKNVQELAKQIIQKSGKDFLDITVGDLRKIAGIGSAKALQIVAAISLVKRFYQEKESNSQTALPLFSKAENLSQLQNRRYIGNKYKLADWIFSILDKECSGNSFTDIFAGTGVVAARAATRFKNVIVNDFLHSNHAIYKAFFDKGEWDKKKTDSIIQEYNLINGKDLRDNYFSRNFGGKYFSRSSAKVIGFIRDDIEKKKNILTEKEYYVLISSLLYAIDKIANTVGHYDAYFKKTLVDDTFAMRSIFPIQVEDVEVYREDANVLARKIHTDIVYIDPPYNSRQYSRFYHVLETLVKWDQPKLYGTALKPTEENMSDYCRNTAKDKLAELVRDIDARFLVVSYNNTYASKSSSSLNKITHEEIHRILSEKGETKVFEKDYRHFNAGNTDFNNHKEFLFVTKTK